jgi:pimeloyl-ACP methyl ester carboxylesterase
VSDAPDPGAFEIHGAEVRGKEIAYIREGVGGFPLLLVHGWPETKRIWWRNIAPLAQAGFEVIVPDLRGFGDSDADLDGFHDLAAHSHDLYALVHDVLGHANCAAAGGDLGGGAIQDLGLRFEGFVVRQVLFNTIMPLLGDEYAAAGLEPMPSREMRQSADYFLRQGKDADALAAELRSDEERRRYISGFYGHRHWATPGAFSRADVDFQTEPFADADHLRASFGNYESAFASRPVSETPRFFEINPVPTLALYGPDDHVIWPDFCERCEVVFSNLVGPFVVKRAGHFLQWERSELLNGALIAFLRDLIS